MTKYDIEIGEDCESSVCHCCNNESKIGHGFIYKNGDAYAVYYAGWSIFHSEARVSFAIAIGEWDDDSTSDDRTCFGLEVYDVEEDIQFRVIEPNESPWASTDLLGSMLSREESLSHPLLKEVYSIIERVVRNHKAIREYLKIKADE